MSIVTNLEFNRYSVLPGNTAFDQDMLMRVEDLASGLSPEEILSYWGLAFSGLNPQEIDYFFVAYNRGVSKSKAKAVDKLFSAMSDKNGGVYALKYLEIFADKFSETEATSNLNHGYTLQIVPTVSEHVTAKAINGNTEPKPNQAKIDKKQKSVQSKGKLQ